MPILGIDEVGRGPLAGPLVVGAVILPEEEQAWFTELNDSKKLTAKKREKLSTLILENSAAGLGWVPADELDKIGISKALQLATHRAVKSVQRLHVPFSQIIIDGKINFLKNTPLEKYTSTLIKADSQIKEVSAASIIAKVARDNYMINLANKFPNYGFEKHVGYGTKAHLNAIYKYGLTEEHRKSYEPCKSLSSFISQKSVAKKNTTKTGQQAEQAVTAYLKQLGHTIVANNHKTYYYEIDIISTKNNYIYFTEVKYRKSPVRGDGLNAITHSKLHQMQFAAESYLKYQNSKLKNYDPLLAVASVSGENYEKITWFPLT
ncbi:ribonuclease HII [Candidatus Saccharibacteria bacterium]|nr:ribonuclease HII [Candidatus Saccharibacteria bacterium]